MLNWIVGLLAIVISAAMLMVTSPASATITYPWCALYSEPGSSTNCGFSTIEQCRATISGIGGYCGENPFYTAPAARRAKRVRKHHSS